MITINDFLSECSLDELDEIKDYLLDQGTIKELPEDDELIENIDIEDWLYYNSSETDRVIEWLKDNDYIKDTNVIGSDYSNCHHEREMSELCQVIEDNMHLLNKDHVLSLRKLLASEKFQLI